MELIKSLYYYISNKHNCLGRDYTHMIMNLKTYLGEVFKNV